MATKLGTVGIIRSQAQEYGAQLRSLGPWLFVGIPFWIWVGRKAYRHELNRQRRLQLLPVLRRDVKGK
ncbi:MAG: hypothetical protein NVSMB42_03390 [Herpetosiphon sp.]